MGGPKALGNFAFLLQGVGEKMYHEVVVGQPLLHWAVEPSPKKNHHCLGLKGPLGARRSCGGQGGLVRWESPSREQTGPCTEHSFSAGAEL